jgi:hypothetical protein
MSSLVISFMHGGLSKQLAHAQQESTRIGAGEGASGSNFLTIQRFANLDDIRDTLNLRARSCRSLKQVTRASRTTPMPFLLLDPKLTH